MIKLRHPTLALGLACAAALGTVWAAKPLDAAPAAQRAIAPAGPDWRIVGMRRLTEAQYRNTIADIFGTDIRVAGRFEPIVRPAHELIASGARAASISPAGLEQFDAMARQIAAQVFDPAHRDQFVVCPGGSGATPDRACLRPTLDRLGRLLFRRPLSPDEGAFYADLADRAATAGGSVDRGLELALAAMLVSPHFLYVIERAEPDPAAPGRFRLDNPSRAARLSFTLWNTTPHAALLDAAAAGELTDPARLRAMAGQMVASPRFASGIRAFFADMLLFERFDELAKDPLVFPYFNPAVAQALPEQMLLTITDHLLTRDGDYRELFTTRQTWMNRPLAALYQVPVSRSQGWVRYEFPEGSDRAGLLGQAGFLAMYSHSGRSSPTLRGRAVRELLMCQPVPNPPGNVNFTAVQDIANRAMPTARIRLDAHNTDPVCAGCHAITDPIGLTLERFDGIGARRTRENDAPIDVSGSIDGKLFEGAAGLGQALAESRDTATCVASRALEYATGKPVDDSARVDALTDRFAARNHRIRQLFLDVVTMPEAYAVDAAPLSGTATRSRRR
ncbi:DUF1592 domain-containing protein [Novosphingobium piscinae]|uniref:DUF1592 domain-containing protein n=1 Tax=Novosphingobium piscinae TaxID=1507448 RepID=A0A7X1FVN8_9SPHN|nr:DUF1592 domain-containing protein [Novosphingobium piscinae]MBC2667821.1 DUF1592 domain-containing protein [Novosphingobium piscinae]